MIKVNKKLVIAFIFLFIFIILLQSSPIIGDTPSENMELIAEWGIRDSDKNNTSFKKIYAIYDKLNSNALLTASNNRDIFLRKAKTSYYSLTNWNNIYNNYWQLSFSTLGYSNIRFNASSWSSSGGTQTFIIRYSTDGDKWSEIKDSSK